jgi:hypothetical protein
VKRPVLIPKMLTKHRKYYNKQTGSLIPALERERQADRKFEACLGYIPSWVPGHPGLYNHSVSKSENKLDIKTFLPPSHQNHKTSFV